MSGTDSRIVYLLVRHLKKNLTDSEQEELNRWIERTPANREWFEGMTNPDSIAANMILLEEAEVRQEIVRLKLTIPAKRPARIVYPHFFKVNPYAVAAGLLLLIALSAILKYRYSMNAVTTSPHLSLGQPDIAPGGNKAMLTLANGSKIQLEDAKSGTIAQQGGSKVSKVASGELTYKSSTQAGAVGFNSVTTPRGGQYKVILPDGTKVWLNAASSIRFPTAFTGSTRVVEITGEAYLEVVHDPRRQFRVKVGEREIEDLGTHFNVYAYRDEPIMKTTLLEGSIRLGSLVLSKPGDQAEFDPATGKLALQENVDLEQVTGWKNGMMIFDQANLETVLRTLSRWYDVDVVYKYGKDTVHLFSGQLSRGVNVSVNLKILAETGYNLQVSGKRIEVLPER